jgi:hypothetical protein
MQESLEMCCMKSSRVAVRIANRYLLRAPAFFVWMDHDGTMQRGEGITVDISACGVFVISDTLPLAGAMVQVDIVLPNLEGSGPGSLLCGEGRVLRVERGEARRGFAATVQFSPQAYDKSSLTRKRNGVERRQEEGLLQ